MERERDGRREITLNEILNMIGREREQVTEREKVGRGRRNNTILLKWP
jgi:hypothetical protein